MSYSFAKRQHVELVRLSKRLKKYQGELYAFLKSGLDPTNNTAEREIRPAVSLRKISYANRFDQGAKNHSIIMIVIKTAKKQGKS